MIIKPARSLAFPGGRPVQLARNHPWNVVGGLRHAVTARPDGALWEARTSKIITAAGPGGMLGRVTAAGPAVVAAAQSANSLYKIPVIITSEPINSVMMVLLQTHMTSGGGQGPINTNYSTGGVKINVAAGSAGIQTWVNSNQATLFNPTIPGHTYLYIGTWRAEAPGTISRGYAVALDLTTGQVEYQLNTATGIQTLTTAADYYGVYTYDGGTTDRHLFHAGALIINGGGFPSLQETLSALEAGNPFDFWYEPTAPSIRTLSLRNPGNTAATLTLSTRDAVDAVSIATSVTVPVPLTLATTDAVDHAAISTAVAVNLMALATRDASDQAVISAIVLAPVEPATGPEYPPAPGPAPIDDVLVGESPVGEVPVFNPWTAVVSQYANSPIIDSLALSVSAMIDPTYDLQSFFDNIWNIGQGPNGYGLDVWGRIVGLSNGRTITALQGDYLGFNEAQPSLGGINTFNYGLDRGFWGGGQLYDGQTLTQNYTLGDDAFQLLIFAKAATNITNGSIPAINQILMNLFPNRGNAYVQENFSTGAYFGFAEAEESLNNVYGFNQASFYNGQTLGLAMQISYVFNFQLTPIELAIVTTEGVMPTPAGVQAIVVQNF